MTIPPPPRARAPVLRSSPAPGRPRQGIFPGGARIQRRPVAGDLPPGESKVGTHSCNPTRTGNRPRRGSGSRGRDSERPGDSERRAAVARGRSRRGKDHPRRVIGPPHQRYAFFSHRRASLRWVWRRHYPAGPSVVAVLQRRVPAEGISSAARGRGPRWRGARAAWE